MMEIIHSILEWVGEIGISGFFDIMFMSLLIYTFLVWFKRTRAAFVLKGIFIIVIVYLVARQFNLVMMAGVFDRSLLYF